MKKTAAGSDEPKPERPEKARSAPWSIHPVVIYPSDRREILGLASALQLVARLDADRDTYARPITVMDRKTITR